MLAWLKTGGCLAGAFCILLRVITHPAWSLPTQTFEVSASIVNGCVISGTNTGVFGSLNFGTLPGVGSRSASTSLAQNAALTLACTPGTTLNLSIDGGAHYSTTRNMQVANNTNLVGYTLYTSANHTAASAIPVSQNVALAFSNANNITLPVYGLVQLSGVNRAGTYSDTLTVTLSW
ncbi:spore coat U domain-containing protein [Erwinia tasmaniensis]|uniref:Csu type fimbrial protein n=1 Tax=Erwinia tasmaniensis TaxID=338565 RepID=UPI003A4DB375